MLQRLLAGGLVGADDLKVDVAGKLLRVSVVDFPEMIESYATPAMKGRGQNFLDWLLDIGLYRSICERVIGGKSVEENIGTAQWLPFALGCAQSTLSQGVPDEAMKFVLCFELTQFDGNDCPIILLDQIGGKSKADIDILPDNAGRFTIRAGGAPQPLLGV